MMPGAVSGRCWLRDDIAVANTQFMGLSVPGLAARARARVEVDGFGAC